MGTALDTDPVEDVAGRAGAENEVDPHRHDEEHDEDVVLVDLLIREQIGDWIANKQADDRVEDS